MLDSAPIQFDEEHYQEEGSRLGNLGMLSTSSSKYTDKPYQHFWEVRSLLISLLQDRTYPLWQRMVILGALCDQLGENHDIPEILDGFRDAIARRLFDESMSQLRPQPAMQVETVVELIISRIGSDYTSPRFRECYQEFMTGLEWTAESTMHDIGSRYAAAYSNYYAPFMAQHEYMLEQYLVNYVHGSLFPFGPQETTQNLSVQRSIAEQYMLVAMYFAIVKAVGIGMAGYHKTAFGADHVIKLVQSCAKTFEHSVAFPARALQLLSGKGLQTCVSLAVLMRN